jgi:hypothetical protein
MAFAAVQISARPYIIELQTCAFVIAELGKVASYQSLLPLSSRSFISASSSSLETPSD